MAPRAAKGTSDDEYAPTITSELSSLSRTPEVPNSFDDLRTQQQLPLPGAQTSGSVAVDAGASSQYNQPSRTAIGNRRDNEAAGPVSLYDAPQLDLAKSAQFSSVAGAQLNDRDDWMFPTTWSNTQSHGNAVGGSQDFFWSQEGNQLNQESADSSLYGFPLKISQPRNFPGIGHDEPVSESAVLTNEQHNPGNTYGYLLSQGRRDQVMRAPVETRAYEVHHPLRDQTTNHMSAKQQAAALWRYQSDATMPNQVSDTGFNGLDPTQAFSFPTNDPQSQFYGQNSSAPQPHTQGSYGSPLHFAGSRNQVHSASNRVVPVAGGIARRMVDSGNWTQNAVAPARTASNVGGYPFNSASNYDTANNSRSYTGGLPSPGSAAFPNQLAHVATTNTSNAMHNNRPARQVTIGDFLKQRSISLNQTHTVQQGSANVERWLSNVQSPSALETQFNEPGVRASANTGDLGFRQSRKLQTSSNVEAGEQQFQSATATETNPFGGPAGTLRFPAPVKTQSKGAVPSDEVRLLPARDHVLENLFGPDPKWNTYIQPDSRASQRKATKNARVKSQDDADGDFQLRSSRASRLAARSHQDTDVLSGYPARQWAKETASVSLVPPKAPQSTETKTQSVWTSPPMPKGSEMYTEFAQKLLAKMRAPRVPEEDKETPEEGEEDAHGEEDNAVKIPKYNLIPLGKEPPGRRFLAERRKGLTSLYEGTGTIQTKRKAKVKQTLADGTEHIIEVLVPEGQTIPGEVSETVAPAVAAELLPAGTVVEGVGVANSEGVVVAATEATTPQSNRRKPPPPKRKKPHPMKGKKKKVMLEVPNADGTVDMVESGTPRADEEDDGDEEEGEEGEGTDDATGTPGSGGTPSAMPEPPRSVPADIPIMSVDSGIGSTRDGQAGDAMEIDAPSTATTNPRDSAVPSLDAIMGEAKSNDHAEGQTQQTEPAGMNIKPSDTAPKSNPETTTTKTPPAQVDEVGETGDHSAPSATDVATASAPQTGASGPPTAIDTEPPAPIEPPIDAQPIALAEPAEVQPAAPVPAPVEPAVPSSEPPIPATGDAVPEVLKPEEIATSNPAEPPIAEVPAAAAATEDAVPEPLKPEEIATSNPVQGTSETKENKDEQPDILGSLEQSLG